MIESRKGGSSENQKPAQTVLPDAKIHNNLLLDSILQQKLTTIERVASGKITGSTTLIEWLQQIQSGTYQNQVNSIRHSDKQTAGKLKKGLPAVTVSGSFSKVEAEALINHSGGICIDIDVKPNENANLFDPEALQTLKTRLREDNTVIAYHHSASGKGLAVYVAIDPAQHNNSFDSIEADYLKNYGVVVDDGCRNVVQRRAASYDPDLYLRASEVQAYAINWEAVSTVNHFDDLQEIKELSGESLTYAIGQIDSVCNQLEQKQDSNISVYFDDRTNWINTLFSLSQLGESGRDLAHRFSRLAPGKYSHKATDKKFDEVLRKRNSGRRKKRTVFSLLYDIRINFNVSAGFIQTFLDYNTAIIKQIYSNDEYQNTITVRGYYLKPEHIPAESCWIAKGATGNGATHQFIHDNTRGVRVLVVPTIAIVQNKCIDTTNVIPVFGKMKPNEIQQAFRAIEADQNQIPVVVCTYDSLPKVSDALAGVANLNEVGLMIDESHQLTESVKYRAKAIHSVLTNYHRYKYCICLSATPVAASAIPVEFQGFKRIRYDFPDIPALQVVNAEYARPVDAVIRLLSKDPKANVEYHIFCNSIRAMKKINKELTTAGLQVRCVYSSGNKENDSTDEDRLIRSDINDEPKQVNIYSQLAYDGIDIKISDDDYKAGKRAGIILISSGKKMAMQTHPATQLLQLGGRVRYTEYQRKQGASARVLHFFDRSKTKIVGKYLQAKRILKSLDIIKQFEGVEANQIPDIEINPDYILNGRVSVLPLQNDLFSVLASATYASDSNIDSIMQYFGIKIADLTRGEKDYFSEVRPEDCEIKEIKIKRKPFKEIVDSLLRANAIGELFTAQNKADLMQFEKSVGRSFVQCFEQLGPDKIKADRPNHLKKRLIIHSDSNDRDKVYYLLKARMEIGKQYTSDQLKKMLQEAYTDLGIDKAIKITSFKDYFIDLKECRLKDTARTKAYRFEQIAATAPKEAEVNVIELIA